jgi:hypothetical protein
MTQRIKLPLVLGSTFAAILSGCLLKFDGLDAGIDDNDDKAEMPTTGDEDPLSLECLIGTELDAIGVARSSWSPGCEVICDEGWGHDGLQLPIEWTESVPANLIDTPLRPVALGLLANGRTVVASVSPPSVSLLFFEPDGLSIGGYDIEEIGGTIYGIEIDSHVLYVAHGDGEGDIELRAVSLDSQQTLWSQTFAGDWMGRPARGGGKIAFMLTNDQRPSVDELVVLDLDGQPQWSRPTAAGGGVAFSPSGDRIAVGGGVTRVYAADDGAVLDEFAHGWMGSYFSPTVTFADEDRVITVASGIPIERLDGQLVGNSLSGGASWEHRYNRATSWCPEPHDDELSASTGEMLVAVATLADGSLVAVGSENFEGEVNGSQPWVAHFSADGEFVASDRGLWTGFAIDTVAGPDGSVFVLIVDKLLTLSEGEPSEEIQGFTVRKYIP